MPLLMPEQITQYKETGRYDDVKNPSSAQGDCGDSFVALFRFVIIFIIIVVIIAIIK